MASNLRSAAVACCLAALAPGCATQESRPLEPGQERLSIFTMQGSVLGGGHGAGFGYFQREPLAGARCIARNDKGTAETTTPGSIVVSVDGGPLIVECTHPEYRAAREEFACVGSRRARATAQGALAGLKIASAMGPAAVYAAPVVVVGAIVGMTAAGAAAGHALAGPDTNVCSYAENGQLNLWLERG